VLDQLPGTIVVILQCCYAGAAAEVSGAPDEDLGLGDLLMSLLGFDPDDAQTQSSSLKGSRIKILASSLTSEKSWPYQIGDNLIAILYGYFFAEAGGVDYASNTAWNRLVGVDGKEFGDASRGVRVYAGPGFGAFAG
jgi:hypothetical protein